MDIFLSDTTHISTQPVLSPKVHKKGTTFSWGELEARGISVTPSSRLEVAAPSREWLEKCAAVQRMRVPAREQPTSARLFSYAACVR